MSIKKAFKQALAEVPFDKVREHMALENWRYAGSDSLPTEADMRRVLNDAMSHAPTLDKDDQQFIFAGGFFVKLEREDGDFYCEIGFCKTYGFGHAPGLRAVG